MSLEKNPNYNNYDKNTQEDNPENGKSLDFLKIHEKHPSDLDNTKISQLTNEEIQIIGKLSIKLGKIEAEIIKIENFSKKIESNDLENIIMLMISFNNTIFENNINKVGKLDIPLLSFKEIEELSDNKEKLANFIEIQKEKIKLKLEELKIIYA